MEEGGFIFSSKSSHPKQQQQIPFWNSLQYDPLRVAESKLKKLNFTKLAVLMIVCINVVQLFAKIILTISVPFFEVALIKDFPIFLAK